MCVEKHSKFNVMARKIIVELNKISHNWIWRYTAFQNSWTLLGDTCFVSLANITVRWILLCITGVFKCGRTFRGFSDDIIWITASKISNERIPQAIFQAFANSSLELTFRQACTPEWSGEVEFLEYTHCIATDGDFRFVANDFLKPTAEEREFLNGKTYQTKFQVIQDNIQVNLFCRSNKNEASQPKESRLHQQFRPTQRKSDLF